MQELEDHERKVTLLLAKHAEKLSNDKVRQEKLKVLMHSNAESKSQAEAGLVSESARQDAAQATEGGQTDVPNLLPAEVSSCQPIATAMASNEVMLQA